MERSKRIDQMAGLKTCNSVEYLIWFLKIHSEKDINQWSEIARKRILEFAELYKTVQEPKIVS
jgi:hypothetical protein